MKIATVIVLALIASIIISSMGLCSTVQEEITLVKLEGMTPGKHVVNIEFSRECKSAKTCWVDVRWPKPPVYVFYWPRTHPDYPKVKDLDPCSICQKVASFQLQPPFILGQLPIPAVELGYKLDGIVVVCPESTEVCEQIEYKTEIYLYVEKEAKSTTSTPKPGQNPPSSTPTPTPYKPKPGNPEPGLTQTPQQTIEPPSTITAPKPKTSVRRSLWLAAGVAVLTLVAVAAIMLSNGGRRA